MQIAISPKRLKKRRNRRVYQANKSHAVLIAVGFKTERVVGDALSIDKGEPWSARYILDGRHVNEELQAGLEAMLKGTIAKYGFAWTWHFRTDSKVILKTVLRIDHPGDH